MNRKRFPSGIVAIFSVLIIGCAPGLQQSWSQATPQERALLVADQLQAELTDLFDLAAAHQGTGGADYERIFQERLLPVFDRANKALRIMILAVQDRDGSITPEAIRQAIRPLLVELITLLTETGVLHDAS